MGQEEFFIAMEKLRKILDAFIPKYARLPLVVAVVVNFSVYGGSRLIAGNWRHYNIEGELDRLIPFWAPSVALYLGCYLFWIVNYILIARQGEKEVYQFFAADFISRMVCLAFYLILPTTNTRPAVEPVGFWNQAVLFLYSIDAADNLFPSIHCLVSWFCYIGIRGQKKVPRWYRITSCALAVLICISTLTTKQHVILDVFGGVFLAEACLYVGKRQAVWETYAKIAGKIHGRPQPLHIN